MVPEVGKATRFVAFVPRGNQSARVDSGGRVCLDRNRRWISGASPASASWLVYRRETFGMGLAVRAMRRFISSTSHGEGGARSRALQQGDDPLRTAPHVEDHAPTLALQPDGLLGACRDVG